MSALGTNLATAARARDRRTAAVMTGQMDPFQAAQSAYAGPAWDAFFGSFQDQAEAGYTPRVDWSGFGNTVGGGASMPRHRGSLGYGANVDEGALNPLEQQTMREIARAQMGNDAVAQARYEQAAQQDYNDLRRENILGSLRGSYDRSLVDAAFAPPEEPTSVQRVAGGPGAADTVVVQPDGPRLDERTRQLRMLPPHLRPAMEQQYAEMDAKAMGAQAAMTKAEADLVKARQPDAAGETLVAVMGKDGQPVLVPRSQAAGMRPANSREQGRAVTATDASDFADFDTSLDELAAVRAAISADDSTGIIARVGATIPYVTQITGWGADAKKRQAVIDRVKQVIGKTLEGGVLRKEDEAKYEKILPNIGDAPDVAATKLTGLEAAITKRKGRRMDALQDAGYDVGQFRARGAGNGSGDGGLVSMVAPDGRPLMVPAVKVAELEAAGAKRR